MESDNIVFWLHGDSRSDILLKLYNDVCHDSLKELSNMIGCHFPSPTDVIDRDSVYKIIRERIGSHNDTQWWGVITDKKKYLLAKLKYGI